MILICPECGERNKFERNFLLNVSMHADGTGKLIGTSTTKTYKQFIDSALAALSTAVDDYPSIYICSVCGHSPISLTAPNNFYNFSTSDVTKKAQKSWKKTFITCGYTTAEFKRLLMEEHLYDFFRDIITQILQEQEDSKSSKSTKKLKRKSLRR